MPLYEFGIAAVERVAVVELDHHVERLARRRGPLEDLLAPQHAQVVVDAALAHELALRGVPQLVVRLGACELVERVDELAPIARVLVERPLRPLGQRLVAVVVVGAVVARDEAELAPGDRLVEERLGDGDTFHQPSRLPPPFALSRARRPSLAGHQRR